MADKTTVGIDVCEIRGLVKDLFDKICGENGREWLEALKQFLRKQNPWVAVAESVKFILSAIKPIAVPAIGKKNTADCFTNTARYYFRDENLDLWLPTEQLSQDAGTFTVYKTMKTATFKELAEDLLNTEGYTKELSHLIKERETTTTLPVIESLIERQERGEDVGLLTNGYANFFFVEDKDGGVSVVRVDRGDGRWGADARRLGNDNGWGGGRRFFARN